MLYGEYEAYVLCGDRSLETALRFLNAFLPRRRSVSTEFPFPELSQFPTVTYSRIEDALRYVVDHPHESYALSWNAESVKNVHANAMLFFTVDGGMIAGLATSKPDPVEVLLSIAEVVQGKFGYITSENRPPDDRETFLKICQEATAPALVNGVIR
jgi:hypothetical protein